MLGEVSPRRGPRKKSDKRIRISSPAKLLQGLIPYLTDFFPEAKLTARLVHGKANSFAVNFPGVSFWQRAAHFDPKITIEVCLYHTMQPSTVMGSLYPDLIGRPSMILIFDSMHF